MARRAKMSDPSPEPRQDDDLQAIDHGDFRRAVQEIIRQKANAAEYVGLAGQATKQAVENLGLNRKALAFAISLQKADEPKRNDMLRSVILYSDILGFFSPDQGEMFDSIIGALEAIVARAHNQPRPAKSSQDEATDAALLN